MKSVVVLPYYFLLSHSSPKRRLGHVACHKGTTGAALVSRRRDAKVYTCPSIFGTKFLNVHHNLADIELNRVTESVVLVCSVYLPSAERTQEESAFIAGVFLPCLDVHSY